MPAHWGRSDSASTHPIRPLSARNPPLDPSGTVSLRDRLNDSSKRQLEIYRKAETGEVVQEIPAPGESVNVDSVGLCLTFEAIYEDSGVE